MIVISHTEHTAIVDQLKVRSLQSSNMKAKVRIDTMMEELFEKPIFWDRKNKRLAVAVKQDALQNAKYFLTRPIEIYRKA